MVCRRAGVAEDPVNCKTQRHRWLWTFFTTPYWEQTSAVGARDDSILSYGDQASGHDVKKEVRGGE